MKEFQGHLNATGMRFGIVVSRFNEVISKSLLSGSMDALLRHGARRDDIVIAWVPGAFEIPLVAKKMAKSGQYDALICLGAVIRGSTAHFDFVAGQNAAGINNVALESELPVLYGVLTCDTIEQALERAGSKAGNKGFDVAMGAIEMVDLLRQLS
jgi:6,7-dimethyl-8-ribityllumazine synthase